VKLGTQVGLGLGHIVLDGNPATFPQRGTVSPQLSAHTCCGQMATWIKMPLGMEVGLGPGDSALDGDTAPAPQTGDGAPQIFGSCLLWPNGWRDQDGTWLGGRPQPRRLCVRWGPSPLLKRGPSPAPQFSAHFYCGQTAGCIKKPLGMEIGINPGDFVLHGDPAPLSPLIFGPCLL